MADEKNLKNEMIFTDEYLSYVTSLVGYNNSRETPELPDLESDGHEEDEVEYAHGEIDDLNECFVCEVKKVERMSIVELCTGPSVLCVDCFNKTDICEGCEKTSILLHYGMSPYCCYTRCHLCKFIINTEVLRFNNSFYCWYCATHTIENLETIFPFDICRLILACLSGDEYDDGHLNVTFSNSDD